MGNLWWSSVHPRLYFFGSNIYAARGDGRIVSFSDYGVHADSDVKDKIFRNSYGIFYRDQRRLALEKYNAAGALVQRATASGGILNYVYSDSSTPANIAPAPGYLIRVSDVFGHAINFTYATVGGNVAVASITDQQGESRELQYSSDGNLQSLMDSNGRGPTFFYENSSLPWALTGVAGDDGARYSTFSYDMSGRAISTEHAGGVNRYAVSYQSPPDVSYAEVRDPDHTRYIRFKTWIPPQTPVVTLPNGASVTLQSTIVAAMPRMTSNSQPGCSNCSSFVSNAAYDVSGNTTSQQDFNGNRICADYLSGRNLESARLEGVPSTAVCPSSIATYTVPSAGNIRKISRQWHPEWDLETRRAEPKKITTWVYNGQVDPTVGGSAAYFVPS